MYYCIAKKCIVLKVSYKKYILKFNFPAGTSRGVYHEKPTWIIKVEEKGKIGYGECGPLKGLSTDNIDLMDQKLSEVVHKLENTSLPSGEKEILQLAYHLGDNDFPSVRFGLEVVLKDLHNGGNRVIYKNDFTAGKSRIPINGLIWMGDTAFMKEQATQKPGKGYGCLKMKIGAISFDQELEIIKEVRKKNPDIVLRLDANGAFSVEEAFKKLEALKQYDIHSIEQPIAPGQHENMRDLCKRSAIPIALDEELISISTLEEKLELLKFIKPQYIILKPTLLGGFAETDQWIKCAEKNDIAWWITSALESNIGLNAIAQYTAERQAISYQGLGTGQLYENNFDSPLTIENGALFYDNYKDWNIEL